MASDFDCNLEKLIYFYFGLGMGPSSDLLVGVGC